MKRLILAAFAAVSLTVPVHAVDTVTPVPMAQDGGMPVVGEYVYSQGQCLPFRMIQWGADLTAVYANGNAATTQSGSIFANAGLNICLEREDNFRQQVKDFASGKTPFLRGTMGQITSASEYLCKDDRTCPQVMHVYSKSNGGDILKANTNKGIKKLDDVCGKTVGLMADGPHMFLSQEMLKLAGANCTINVKWYQNLGLDKDTGSAAHAFAEGEVDAAFVIYPDAVELQDGDSKVAGAKDVFSTQSLNQTIIDVVAVRSDFAKANPDVVKKLSNGLFRANEAVAKLFNQHGAPAAENHASGSPDYKALAAAGAEHILGVAGDSNFDFIITEMRAFDLKMFGWTDAVNFLHNSDAAKKGVFSIENLTSSAGNAFVALGLLNTAATATKVAAYQHNWDGLKDGLAEKFGVVAPVFNKEGAQKTVEKMVQSGKIDDKTIVSFEITFDANQMDFDPNQYTEEFTDMLEKMQQAPGAIVAVGGHSGTYKYLVMKHGKKKVDASVWRQAKQSAKNLSMRRAHAVVTAAATFAKQNGFNVPFDGVVPVGYGVTKPATGMCDWGGAMDPCGPENKKSGAAWKANEAKERRVTILVIDASGEAEAFADNGF